MKLRYYQQDAVNAVYEYLSNHSAGNPCIVIPTGGGKTPVIATLIKDVCGKWGGRVCVLAHRKELLEQTWDKIKRIAPELDVGIYSASLKERKTQNAVILGQIQSVAKRAFEFDRFDLVIVDEAHLIPPKGEGLYRRFLQDCYTANPQLRIVGLTATPYRMASGMICDEQNILTDICYEVGVLELIQQAYLCRLVSKRPAKLDTSELHIRNGEFVQSEAEELMMQIVNSTVHDLVKRTEDRHSVIVFCQGVKHAELVAEQLRQHDDRTEMVTGETISTLRNAYLEQFKQQKLKYLVNVDVLTTGFDATNIDCVALLRPTLSPGLYYQMVGRGLRIDDSKQDCLVLDYGGNVDRHGQIDRIEVRERKQNGPKKTADVPDGQQICQGCQSYIDASYDECPECGYETQRSKEFVVKHDTTAAEVDVVSSGEDEVKEWVVQDVEYKVHHKKDAPPEHPRTLRVMYHCTDGSDGWQDGEIVSGLQCPDCADNFGGVVRAIEMHEGPHKWKAECECGRWIKWLPKVKGNIAHVTNRNTFSEWVCIEHDGFARKKAEAWWAERSTDPMPDDAQQAVDVGNGGGLAIPLKITTRKPYGEKYAQIESVELGEIPQPMEAEVTTSWQNNVGEWSDFDDEDVPF